MGEKNTLKIFSPSSQEELRRSENRSHISWKTKGATLPNNRILFFLLSVSDNKMRLFDEVSDLKRRVSLCVSLGEGYK